MADKIIRPDKPKKEDLINLYDILNKIIKKEDCFYTKEELKEKTKGKEDLK